MIVLLLWHTWSFRPAGIFQTQSPKGVQTGEDNIKKITHKKIKHVFCGQFFFSDPAQKAQQNMFERPLTIRICKYINDHVIIIMYSHLFHIYSFEFVENQI